MNSCMSDSKQTYETEIEMVYDHLGIDDALTHFWADVGETFQAARPRGLAVVQTAVVDSPKERNENFHHFYGSGAEETCENHFQKGRFDAESVSVIRTRRAGGDEWVHFGGPTEHVIEASGREIPVPDDVRVVTDEENVPHLNRETREGANKRYTTGRPFATWRLKTDWQSSAWWAYICPNPGSADEEYADFYEDEARAAKEAISLAQRFDVPLLIW